MVASSITGSFKLPDETEVTLNNGERLIVKQGSIQLDIILSEDGKLSVTFFDWSKFHEDSTKILYPC